MRIKWLLVGCILAGCSSKPQTFAPSEQAAITTAEWQNAIALSTEHQDMLSLVSNTQLDHWLDSAINKNPGIQRLIFQQTELDWVYRQANAQKTPDVSINADANRQKDASKSIANSYKLGLTTSWEMDVWGRISNQADAAAIDAQVAQSDIEFAKRSLAANFIKAWLGWVNAKQAIANEQQRIDSLSLTKKVIEDRYTKGLGNLQDLQATLTSYHQSRSNLASLQQSEADLARQLQQLSGSTMDISELPNTWPDVGFPKVSLPASNLGQRADLIAAYQRVRAADKRSQVAFQNLLPKFTFNFDLSSNSSSAGDLLSTDPVWSFLTQISQPLFQQNQLAAQLEAQQQQAAQAYWQYRESLLIATLEVEAGLSKEQSLGQQFAALEKAFKHASNSLEYGEKRYRTGLIDIQNYLSTQRTKFDVYAQLLQISLARAQNRIDLALALGLPIQRNNNDV